MVIAVPSSYQGNNNEASSQLLDTGDADNGLLRVLGGPDDHTVDTVSAHQ